MKNNPNRFWAIVILLGWAFDFLFWKKPYAQSLNIRNERVASFVNGSWFVRIGVSLMLAVWIIQPTDAQSLMNSSAKN